MRAVLCTHHTSDRGVRGGILPSARRQYSSMILIRMTVIVRPSESATDEKRAFSSAGILREMVSPFRDMGMISC